MNKKIYIKGRGNHPSFFLCCCFRKRDQEGVTINESIYVGKRFGKLEVISLNNENYRGRSWLCKCDCGKEVVFSESHLLGTKTRRPNKSCGCAFRNKNKKLYPRIYNIWYGMIQRCYDPSRENYDRYGGKGVTVCKEWINSFDTFFKWALENRYKENLTIDRINPLLPYEPNNCRWADYFVQEQNKGLYKNNTTGYTGVCNYKYGYRAYITRFGKTKNLGTYKHIKDAIRARKIAEAAYK